MSPTPCGNGDSLSALISRNTSPAFNRYNCIFFYPDCAIFCPAVVSIRVKYAMQIKRKIWQQLRKDLQSAN
jgi:hypothetical protein